MPVNIKQAKAKVEASPHKPKKTSASKDVDKGPGAFKKIHDMGEEKVAMMNDLFLKGKSVPAIIEVLQDGWGEFKDTQVSTLTKYLYRYKWEVVNKGLVVEKALDVLVKTGDKQMGLVQEALEDLNVLREVHELVIVQKGRVRKLLQREADLPVLLGTVAGEMKTLSGFLQQFVEMSFDMGVIKRAPSVTKVTKDGITHTVESEGKDHVALSLASSDQVADAAEEFFKVLDEVGQNDGNAVH